MVSYGTLAIFTGSVPLLFIIVFSFMPESPFWLLSKGETTAAGKSLAWLRGYDSKDGAAVSEELDELEHAVQEDMKNVKSFRDLFATPGNRKGLLIVEALALIQRMSGWTSQTIQN